MDHSASFQRVAAHLPGWTVAGYDRRGWGTSRTLADPQTKLADHVTDLISAASRLPKPIVAGHSYGALVALIAAAQHPRLSRAAVVFEPPVCSLPWWPRTAPWEQLVEDASARGPAAAARALHEAVVGRPTTGQTDEELEAAGTALIREMTDPTLSLPSIDPTTLTTPVITASGSRSLKHHRQTALHLANLIPAGRHASIDGADHLAHVTHPQALAALIEQAAAMDGG
ncbi:pimeloyl-ACP methyl ester carboxylesterase [Amycolatopsis cihanbeyliensis]|uniref:Pimeloyl-ACP methyl ester carboxylesterase n=2 Tax=Amycolatopsis cihanbeyliensis TaxID=1128664 RepID=A0A542DF13_AMYCI|nr:pimeloyl-ACP methyl ester carboxylesterase [Amycolatopsis cihanbeyliensis]